MKIKSLILSAFGLAACQATAQDPSFMSLAGSEWGTSVERQFVRFGVDGKVTGNGGCNRFFGIYSQDEKGLNIGPLGATKMACPNLRQEQAFFQILNTARKVQASHLQLVLQDTNGKILLTLKRRDWD